MLAVAVTAPHRFTRSPSTKSLPNLQPNPSPVKMEFDPSPAEVAAARVRRDQASALIAETLPVVVVNLTGAIAAWVARGGGLYSRKPVSSSPPPPAGGIAG